MTNVRVSTLPCSTASTTPPGAGASSRQSSPAMNSAHHGRSMLYLTRPGARSSTSTDSRRHQPELSPLIPFTATMTGASPSSLRNPGSRPSESRTSTTVRCGTTTAPVSWVDSPKGPRRSEDTFCNCGRSPRPSKTAPRPRVGTIPAHTMRIRRIMRLAGSRAAGRLWLRRLGRRRCCRQQHRRLSLSRCSSVAPSRLRETIGADRATTVSGGSDVLYSTWRLFAASTPGAIERLSGGVVAQLAVRGRPPSSRRTPSPSSRCPATTRTSATWPACRLPACVCRSTHSRIVRTPLAPVSMYSHDAAPSELQNVTRYSGSSTSQRTSRGSTGATSIAVPIVDRQAAPASPPARAGATSAMVGTARDICSVRRRATRGATGGGRGRPPRSGRSGPSSGRTRP